jgi:hypothetical protein
MDPTPLQLPRRTLVLCHSPFDLRLEAQPLKKTRDAKFAGRPNYSGRAGRRS